MATDARPLRPFKCPRCGQAATWQNNPARPFCSDRCKLIDLGAWASEDYRMTAEDAPMSGELGESGFED